MVILYACFFILVRMPDNSFDVVSVVDMPEVLNAAQQARKEVQTRFDLKDSKSEIELNEKDKKFVINSIDDFKLKAVVEVLQQKLAKRKVPLKNFSYGPIVAVVRIDSPSGDHDSVRHPDREVEGNRQEDQGQ